jgi:hypothetical protein
MLGDRRGYSHLKKEALDRIKWRNRLGEGCGPVVWQITGDDDDDVQPDPAQFVARAFSTACAIRVCVCVCACAHLRFWAQIRYKSKDGVQFLSACNYFFFRGSHIAGETQAEGGRKQGADEDIWA